MSGAAIGSAASGAPMGGPPGLFNNALFNSATSAQAMPQYVAQPSIAGAQPDVIATRKGQPIYGPPKAFNPYQAVPAWAQQPAGNAAPQGIAQGAIASQTAQSSPAPTPPKLSSSLLRGRPNGVVSKPAESVPVQTAPNMRNPLRGLSSGRARAAPVQQPVSAGPARGGK